MASSNQAKRKKIFNLFSLNLEWVKSHPSISFVPDFINGYICPLCFVVFFESDLEPSSNNPLTLEDVPPKSLGGKPLVLTCKKCNSRSGHELDSHLLNTLLNIDSRSFLPNSKSNASFELFGNKVNGIFKVDGRGEIILNFQTERSNPLQAKNFIKDLIPNKTLSSSNPLNNQNLNFDFKTPPFQLNLTDTSDERRAEIALLRIAYLKAFSFFGNGYFINGPLYKIREQILNPDIEVIPKVFWIKYQFPKEMLGINIITLPKDLRCFLVIFNLTTKSLSRQFAIVLPGPSNPGLKVYDFIQNVLCSNKGSELANITTEHISDDDFIINKDLVFESDRFWFKYTGPDYKPNFKPHDKGK